MTVLEAVSPPGSLCLVQGESCHLGVESLCVWVVGVVGYALASHENNLENNNHPPFVRCVQEITGLRKEDFTLLSSLLAACLSRK